jgi:hypothetical protein
MKRYRVRVRVRRADPTTHRDRNQPSDSQTPREGRDALPHSLQTRVLVAAAAFTPTPAFNATRYRSGWD